MIRKIFSLAYLTVKKHIFTFGFISLSIIFFLIPFWCSYLQGDGTAEGKFKVFVTYSFLLSSMILITINIAFSCVSISDELKKKTMFLLDSKPLKRGQVILGKWIGFLFLNFLLILSFLLSMSLFSVFLSKKIKSNFKEEKNIFLTYAQISPYSFISGEEEKSKLKKRETYAIPPGGKITWNFKGIKNVSSNIYLTFKFYTSKKEEKEITGYWLIGNPSMEKPVEVLTEFSQNEVHRLKIPSECVSKKGQLQITYMNIDPENISVLFNKEELKIRYPWKNYWDNLLRSGFNLLLVTGFISAMGIFFSAIVSTLTAAISTSVLIFISYLHGFTELIVNSLMGEKKIFTYFSYPLLKFSLFILPPLNKFLPHIYIEDSLILPFSYLKDVFLKTTIFGAVPILILAILYFSKRELGVFNE